LISGRGWNIYLLKNPHTGPGAYTALTTCVYFLGGKEPEHQAEHSPPSSANVKDEWSYTSLTVTLSLSTPLPHVLA